MSTWREMMVASGLPLNEARLLAAHAAGRARSWMLAHDDEEAAKDALDAAHTAFVRRRAGEPVAYILGEREFYSLMFAVTPAVLIPRPETELLVDLVLERLPLHGSLIDIGTGSGAIAVAVAHARPDVEVWACDISMEALAVAQSNSRRHGTGIRFVQSDLLATFTSPALAGKRFDVIVSNPPYIAEGDAHLSTGDLRFEPHAALASGTDGLTLIRRLAAEAPAHLKPAGWLLFEHGYDQGGICHSLLQSMEYKEVFTNIDLAGHPRVCAGRTANLT